MKFSQGLRDVVRSPLSTSAITGVLIVGVCSLLTTGCVAQQADLARIQKDLEQQIAKIKDEKKALGAQVDEAKSAIIESQNLLAQQKADMIKMQEILAPRRDFADLHQKVTLIREQDLPMLYGKNEEAAKQIQDLQKSFTQSSDSMQSQIGTLQNTLQAHGDTLKSQGEQIQTAQAQTATLAQEEDNNNQTLTNNMTEFQLSLGQFKEALGDVGLKIQGNREDLTAQHTSLLAQDEKLHTLEVGSRQLSQSVAELSQSLLQLREAVGTSGNLVGGRLDEQEGQVMRLQQEISGLRETFDKDTQALRIYLEQDVKTAMGQLIADIDKRQEPLFARIDGLQKDMETLGTHVQADAALVQDLSQSVLKLREAQEVMGSLLGKRGDEIIQQAGRISERMNTVESHQTALAEQLQSNTQKTSSHLAEVHSSLNSISQALDQTNQSLSGRLVKQEEAVAGLNQTLQQFRQLKLETHDQIQQMQNASQLTDQLRQTVEQVSSRLQELEIHQLGLVGKLDSDAQVTNTHLQEVNSGIKSMAQALEHVSAKLNSRIDDQEQRLNRAMTTFQRVQNTADTSQTNLAHLNKLTETVNQLRDIVGTIGTKLGERVDQHEDRLGQLAQRVNRLQSPKQQK